MTSVHNFYVKKQHKKQGGIPMPIWVKKKLKLCLGGLKPFSQLYKIKPD